MGLPQRAENEFELGRDLAEAFLTRCRGLVFCPGADVTYEIALLFFFCKSYKTSQGIEHLWRAGFCEDAWLLTRTLFEIWMQAAYMREKPRERARQFLEHDPIRQYRAYKELKEIGADAQAKAFEGRLDFAEIQRQFFDRDVTTPWHWWGKSINALAKQLGRPFDKEYVIGYWWQSNVVHSSVTAMQHYVLDAEGEVKMNCHPGDKDPELDIKLAPRGATMMMISIIEEISEGLSIDIREKISSAKRAVSALPKSSMPK